MPTEGGIRGSLLHAVPVPLPVFRTPPLWPMDADPWGSRSSRNGHSQPQWRPPTAHLESPPPPPPGADPRCERTPHPAPRRQVLHRPYWAPGGFPATLATPGNTTGTDHPPTASGISTCAVQVYPALGALPARFQPQWPSLRAQLGSPPLPPPGADTRPVPPGFAPPLPRSRGAAHLHQRLSVSPVPTPGSRRGSRTSLLLPGQT